MVPLTCTFRRRRVNYVDAAPIILTQSNNIFVLKLCRFNLLPQRFLTACHVMNIFDSLSSKIKTYVTSSCEELIKLDFLYLVEIFSGLFGDRPEFQFT